MAETSAPAGSTEDPAQRLDVADAGYAGESAGLILGTAGYMSPEQARGKPVDRRSDIWAFGCVLYEMLTGRRTFETGETVSDAVAAILTREPDWRALPPQVPESIRRLLRRCLEKEPDRRLHHIADARMEINDAISAPPALADDAASRRGGALRCGRASSRGPWRRRPSPWRRLSSGADPRPAGRSRLPSGDWSSRCRRASSCSRPIGRLPSRRTAAGSRSSVSGLALDRCTSVRSTSSRRSRSKVPIVPPCASSHRTDARLASSRIPAWSGRSRSLTAL